MEQVWSSAHRNIIETHAPLAIAPGSRSGQGLLVRDPSMIGAEGHSEILVLVDATNLSAMVMEPSRWMVSNDRCVCFENDTTVPNYLSSAHHTHRQTDGAGCYTPATMIGVCMDAVLDNIGALKLP